MELLVLLVKMVTTALLVLLDPKVMPVNLVLQVTLARMVKMA